MKILKEKKLESGDYEIECDFTEEELEIPVSYAFNKLLKKWIKKESKRKDKKKNDRI